MADFDTPGRYVSEHRDGHFWNGQYWEQGGTVDSSTTTPAQPNALAGSPFGGTIINQQRAAPSSVTPTPVASSTAPTGGDQRPSILSTIMRVESGGRNVPQQIDDINMRRGDPAQGYYQITGGTWREFGGDRTGHKSAIDAPYATQLQIAQNIPVARWGADTQAALKQQGYVALPGETLGQMLVRYGEDPMATRPTDGGTMTAAATDRPTMPTPPALSSPTDQSGILAGLLAQQQQDKEAQGWGGITKSGMGLLEQGTTSGTDFSRYPQAAVHRGDPSAFARSPDFMQVLAQQRLMRGM